MTRLMRKLALLSVLLIGTAGILENRAEAALMVDFTFDQPNQTVGTTDSVKMFATLTNRATSTENLVSGGHTKFTVGMVWGSLIGDGRPYDWKIDNSVFNFLLNLVLKPGESHNFLFGTLVPVKGSVAPGTYISQGGYVRMNDIEYGGYGQTPFEVTVVAKDVPAPAGLALFAIGLAGLAAMRKSRKA